MIPQDWIGKTCAVIASGPSLTPEDVAYCRGKAIVAVVNDNYRLAPWADLLYAADYRWWDHHDGVVGFAGERWTQDERAAKEFGLNWVAGRDAAGFSFDRERIHYGRNSGFQCCNIAILRGAARILLLGFDMQAAGRRRHWFGDHPGELNRDSDYAGWVLRMNEAAQGAKDARVEIINCSRVSALTAYPRARLADCL